MKRTLRITTKSSDNNSIAFIDSDGIKHTAEFCYVPRGIGIGGDDYIELEINMETGQILNFPKLTDEQIIRSIKENM